MLEILWQSPNASRHSNGRSGQGNLLLQPLTNRGQAELSFCRNAENLLAPFARYLLVLAR
jgi:hypothetical protein